MHRTLIAAGLGLAIAAFGMILVPKGDAAARRGGPPERWVNANLLHVEVDGRWERVPLMPLADHLCKSNDPHFERFCD